MQRRGDGQDQAGQVEAVRSRCQRSQRCRSSTKVSWSSSSSSSRRRLTGMLPMNVTPIIAVSAAMLIRVSRRGVAASGGNAPRTGMPNIGYFESKEALLLAVLAERLPGLVDELEDLQRSVDLGSVDDNVRLVVRAATRF